MRFRPWVPSHTPVQTAGLASESGKEIKKTDATALWSISLKITPLKDGRMIANATGRLEQLLTSLRLESHLGACNIPCPSDSIWAVWSLKKNVRKIYKNAGQVFVL